MTVLWGARRNDLNYLGEAWRRRDDLHNLLRHLAHTTRFSGV